MRGWGMHALSSTTHITGRVALAQAHYVLTGGASMAERAYPTPALVRPGLMDRNIHRFYWRLGLNGRVHNKITRLRHFFSVAKV